MAKVILPGTLSELTGGAADLTVAGETAGEVLRQLVAEHPRLKGWVLDERGLLPQHVNVFVSERRADLATPVGAGESVYVLQAISGGSGNRDPADGRAEMLVGTKKGLFLLHGRRGEALATGERLFPGQVVEFAMRDPRTGVYFASVTHGQFDPRIFYASDPAGEWQQADGPAFPEDADAAVERVWVIESGEGEWVLWAGSGAGGPVPEHRRRRELVAQPGAVGGAEPSGL